MRGVIAPETANNAMKGGALIPTIAFGIPGSAAMAILMSAADDPGDDAGAGDADHTRLDFTFSLVWMLAIANVAGALILMLLARYIARVTFISGHLLVPVIVLFVFMGAWLANSSIGDWVVLLAFGCVGYLMKRGGVPRPPLVLGFVIGPIMENALFITTSVHDGLEWLARPICLVIGALIVGSIVFAARRRRSMRAGNAVGAPEATSESAPKGVQTEVKRVANLKGIPRQEQADPTMALLATGFLLAVSAFGLAPTFSWPTDVGQFPMLTFIPAIGLSLAALWHSVRDFRHARAAGRDIFPGREALGGAGRLYLWWLCMLAATVLAGQLIALPVFAALYLKLRGGYAWWTALIYAAGACSRFSTWCSIASWPCCGTPRYFSISPGSFNLGRVRKARLTVAGSAADTATAGGARGSRRVDDAGLRAQAPPVNSSATSNFRIFPMALRGSSPANRTTRGTLYPARCSRQKSMTPSGSASAPSFATSTATTR